MKTTSMEDDLKILKVKYLTNNLLDHSQILNLSLDDQSIFLKSSKVLRVEYLSNHCMDHEFLGGN